MFPLNSKQLSKSDTNKLTKPNINDVIKNDVYKDQYIDRTSVSLNDATLLTKEIQNKNVVKSDKEKWMDMLKKRGPRLRQPTISISNYSSEQLVAHERISVKQEEKEKKEEKNKEPYVDPKYCNFFQEDFKRSQKEINKAKALKKENAEKDSIKKEIIEKETTELEKIQKETIMGTNLKINNLSTNISFGFIKENKEKEIMNDDKAKWLADLKKKGPRRRQPTLSIFNFDEKQTAASEMINTQKQNVIIEKKPPKVLLQENSYSIQRIVEKNLEDKQQIYKQKKSKVSILIDFYTNLDKRAKNHILNKEKYEKLEINIDQVIHQKEYRKEEISKVKTIKERTFNFKDLLNKWKK